MKNLYNIDFDFWINSMKELCYFEGGIDYVVLERALLISAYHIMQDKPLTNAYATYNFAEFRDTALMVEMYDEIVNSPAYKFLDKIMTREINEFFSVYEQVKQVMHIFETATTKNDVEIMKSMSDRYSTLTPEVQMRIAEIISEGKDND